MTRAINKMPTPEGIGAGQTATCRLPLGYTYNRLLIRMADGVGDIAEAAWGSNIGEIRVMVDGDAKIQIDAADLVSLNKYYGHTHDAGVLPIFLSRHWMRTILGEDQTGYDTAGGMSSFTLEMDLQPAITIGQLNVFAEQSDPRDPITGQMKAWGAHYRLQKYTHNQGVVGEAQISDIVRGPYSVMAIHAKTASISTVEVLADGKKFYDTDTVIRDQYNRMGGRVPQTGFTHVDFIPDNRLSDAFPMAVQDFRLKANFTATGSVPMYVESIQGAGMVAA